MTEEEIAERFRGRFAVVGECWEFQGYRLNGYGQAKIEGRNQLVHRYVLALCLGRPLNDWALHRCNNPPCFRPRHLYEGTPADNVLDRQAASTTAQGERNGSAKLTLAAVLSLRADRSAGVSYRRLAAKYGITHQSARDAALGKTWRSA